MTTINLTNVAPPTLSGLACTSADSAIKIRWDASSVMNDLWATEVWSSATNDRSTATLINTEIGSSTVYTTTPNTTRFFWIRAVSKNGFNNGAWYPSGSTSGVSGTSNPLQVVPTSTVSSASVASGGGIAGGTLTNWSQWYNAAYEYFTVPSSGNGQVNGYGYVVLTFGAISGVTGSNQTNVQLRVRLYDNTVGADVIGGTDYYQMLTAVGNSITASQTMFSFNLHNNFGQLGVLIPGHTYYIYVDVQKTRADTTTVLSVSISQSTCNVTSNTIS